MRRFLTAACLLLLSSCGSSPPPPSSCAVPPRLEEAKVQTIKYDDWSLTLPTGWKFEQEPGTYAPEESGITKQLLACTGDGPQTVCVILLSMPWSKADGTPEAFGPAVGLFTINRPGIQVLNATGISVSGHTGTSVTFIRKNVVMTQVSVGVLHHGYVLSCGGAVHRVAEVTKQCSDIIKTFKLD
jgi:hypothetical protein